MENNIAFDLKKYLKTRKNISNSLIFILIFNQIKTTKKILDIAFKYKLIGLSKMFSIICRNNVEYLF